jgi:hypothetical protein
MMSEASPALEIALRYHEAWTSHDVERAMGYVADDVVCEAPAGTIQGAAAYRAFLEPFVQMLLSARMLAAFGDDHTALVMYDTETRLVPSAPGAECVQVVGGRITHSRFLFDRAPFDAARLAHPA